MILDVMVKMLDSETVESEFGYQCRNYLSNSYP